MEINDDEYFDRLVDDANSPWYSPKWAIYNISYVLDDISASDLNDFFENKRDDLKVINLNEDEMEVLNAFGSFDFSNYATTCENYLKQITFLESIGIRKEEKYLTVILALLKVGCWGIYQEGDSIFNYAEYVGRTEKEFISEKKRFKYVSELFQRLRYEKLNLDHIEEEGEAKFDLKFPLESVVFKFKCADGSSEDKVFKFITVPGQRNPIANFLSSYYEILKDDRRQIFEKLGFLMFNQKLTIDDVFPPYKLFCYRFIQFLDEKITLSTDVEASRNNLLLVYYDLLIRAKFTVNISPSYAKYPANRISYLKKWYYAGKKIEESSK
ncbi:hypothetical protein [Dyadobacter frigoris]|uniref:Uncharacterized protein n=1 Tax=Dyadobacter frigoris TaxID=2576211 RepID=A0A4U6DBE2_9BACT|nr:hypothetical protein [Dyadobacter frigoris]TKT94166.1 hypothetical protein FDK13_02850 [Dyadobacter frigoris]